MLRVYIIVDLTTDEDDNSTELYMCGAGRDSCSTASTVAIPLTRLWQAEKYSKINLPIPIFNFKR